MPGSLTGAATPVSRRFAAGSNCCTQCLYFTGSNITPRPPSLTELPPRPFRSSLITSREYIRVFCRQLPGKSLALCLICIHTRLQVPSTSAVVLSDCSLYCCKLLLLRRWTQLEVNPVTLSVTCILFRSPPATLCTGVSLHGRIPFAERSAVCHLPTSDQTVHRLWNT